MEKPEKFHDATFTVSSFLFGLMMIYGFVVTRDFVALFFGTTTCILALLLACEQKAEKKERNPREY